MLNHPKIALVHDYIKEYGGAERVLEALHEMYPEAPIYTMLYAPDFLGPHKERFKNWNIKPSFIQYIPYSYKYISILRIFAPLIFRSFDLSSYDVVIVSATGAYSPNMIRTKGKHICYCHTPPRYLYGYATAREYRKNPVMKVFIMLMCHVLRMVDYASSRHVDLFIANSQNVAGRIKKFYRRDSVVIYPPVDIRSSPNILISQYPNIPYYLAGGRLARPKHIDLIVKACTELKVSLKIFGRGFAGYEEELKDSKIRNPHIQFLGEVKDEKKLDLMIHAKAFIFAAEDEDFGIVPVEAMSVGIPVIAYKSGGVLETVIEGKTGIFFHELTEKSVIDAMKKFEKMKINPEDCREQAKKFSKERFMERMKNQIAHFDI